MNCSRFKFKNQTISHLQIKKNSSDKNINKTKAKILNDSSISDNLDLPTLRRQDFHNQQLNSLKTQNQKLRQQNSMLKVQINWLKTFQIQTQSQEKIDQTKIQLIAKLQSQKIYFKQLIQKSYYSIKQIQKQNINLYEKLSQIKLQNDSLNQTILSLNKQNKKLKNQLQQIQTIHQSQIYKLNQKIGKMNLIIQKIIDQLELDKEEWENQKYQIINLKNYYYGNAKV